jgi:hypothetical protein
MQISFESDIKRLSHDLHRIKASAIPTATSQALNKTIKGVRSDLTKMLSKVTGIIQKDVRSELKVTTATKAQQVAKVDSRTGRAKNLINFVSKSHRKAGYFNAKLGKGKRRRYRATGVKAKAWNNRKTYDGSFIGTGKNGATLVFTRDGSATTRTGKGKLKSLRGPSIRQEFKRQYTQAFIKSQSTTRFHKEMKAAIKYQISKVKTR